MSSIPGYTKGQPSVPRAPISLTELEELKKSALLTDEDAHYLRMAGEVLVPRVEELLDVWYGFVGSNPHLVSAFARTSDGKPDEGYLGAVRKRFGQWVRDTCEARFDQHWLDYQFEIGRRHHRSGKNRTDGVQAAANVPFRHLVALIAPIALTVRPFLEKSGRPAADVEKMQAAWLKAVVLQVALWSHPYVREGDY
ncbi:MAG: protoglobin domain-containing protein [Myxococcota bacterium]|nr:protoglobin domain-containing protein [Myxococcota bacterium]MDW8361566.1 protoglobin domain-containing protein [Myxococcales bacterium]